ncbi:hypothetical protein [Rubellimicrobium mesophilum]|nr:hypothetical protein [Rubellimicrobium mesophilum]
MLNLAASLLARLAELLAPLERQPALLPIPVRRDDGRGPRRGDRRA